MDIFGLFTKHPATVGESYGRHLAGAASFGIRMLAGGAACLVHAVFPFLFTTTGSSIVRRLNEDMVVQRRRVPDRYQARPDERNDHLPE